jgi:hypothetical protein
LVLPTVRPAIVRTWEKETTSRKALCALRLAYLLARREFVSPARESE